MNLGAFAVRDRGRAPHAQRRDLVVRRPVPDVARARGHDDDLPGVARRHPAPRGLVRQVRDVPLDHRRRHRSWAIALAVDRRGQLGDRVLLLLRRDPARCGSASPAGDDRRRVGVPPALGAAIALTTVDRRRGRRLPAAVRPGRRARDASSPESVDATPIAGATLARLIRREGPITFDRFVEAALYGRGRLLRVGPRRRSRIARGRRLRHEPRGRFALRCVRRRGARPVVGRARAARSVPRRRGRRGQRPARARRAARRAALPARAALRARRAVGGAARRAARAAAARTGRRGARSVRRGAAAPTRRCRCRRAGRCSPRSTSCPGVELDGVVLANELLDNLPFGIAASPTTGWAEVRVGLDDAGDFDEVLVPALPADAAALDADHRGPSPSPGDRLPIPRGLDDWLRRVRRRCAAATSC